MSLKVGAVGHGWRKLRHHFQFLSIVYAVVMVAHNILQGFGQGFGSTFNLFHPVGGRAGFDGG